MKIELKAKDTEKLLTWLNRHHTKVKNLNPLWKILKPIILRESEHEFDGSNPNFWKPLSQPYLRQKVADGYPAIIGVRTGGLKWAATKGATISTHGTRLTWGVNDSHMNSEGVRVRDYAGAFNTIRKIFKYTKRYLNKAIKTTVTNWLKSNVRSNL